MQIPALLDFNAGILKWLQGAVFAGVKLREAVQILNRSGPKSSGAGPATNPSLGSGSNPSGWPFVRRTGIYITSSTGNSEEADYSHPRAAGCRTARALRKSMARARAGSRMTGCGGSTRGVVAAPSSSPSLMRLRTSSASLVWSTNASRLVGEKGAGRTAGGLEEGIVLEF